VVVEYCPTEDMISDVLTKPLQGSAFHKLRTLLLNIKDDPTNKQLVSAHRSVLKPITTESRATGETWHDDATVRTSGSRRGSSNAVNCR
jgi:hypothetical protein